MRHGLWRMQRRQESFIRREQGNIDRIRDLEEQLALQRQQREADIASGRDEFGTKGAVIRCQRRARVSCSLLQVVCS